MSPANLTSAGGLITVTANVTDTNPGVTINTPTGNILNGVTTTPLSFSLSSPGVYSATFTAPANATVNPITFTSNASVTDSFSQSSGQVNSSNSTVEAGVPPLPVLIHGVSITNTSGASTLSVTLTNAGGTTASNLALVLAHCKWGGMTPTSVTPSAGVSLAPGNQTTFTLQFPASSTAGTATISGVYSGGNFTTILKILFGS
jgi:hypothetical protein